MAHRYERRSSFGRSASKREQINPARAAEGSRSHAALSSRAAPWASPASIAALIVVRISESAMQTRIMAGEPRAFANGRCEMRPIALSNAHRAKLTEYNEI